MTPIDRIKHWNDEEQRLWRAGVMASTRSRLYTLVESRTGVLLLAAAGAVALSSLALTM